MEGYLRRRGGLADGLESREMAWVDGSRVFARGDSHVREHLPICVLK
jgi:hypothetical protein